MRSRGGALAAAAAVAAASEDDAYKPTAIDKDADVLVYLRDHFSHQARPLAPRPPLAARNALTCVSGRPPRRAD